MKRTLNTKLLLWTLTTLLGISAGLYFWYHAQVKRNAGALLHQADRALAEGQTAFAVKHLSHYLAFNPDDTEALAKYGGLLDKSAMSVAQKLRALQAYDKLLRRDPAQADIRRRSALLTIELQRFADAIRHLEVLGGVTPPKVEDVHLLACCLDASGATPQAISAFQRAIALAPQHLDSYVLLAELWQRLEEPDQASDVIEALTKANPKSARAYFYRAKLQQKYGDLADASQALDRALQLAPSDVDALETAAEVALARHQFDDARRFLEQGILAHPKRARFYRLFATLELDSGQALRGIRVLQDGVHVLPASIDLRARLVDALLDDQQLQLAHEHLTELRQRKTAPALVDYLAARFCMSEGNWLEACERFERLLGLPALPAPWAGRAQASLGRCYEEFGEIDRQLGAFRRAVALARDHRPAQLGLARSLMTAGLLDDAEALCRQLSQLHQPPADLWTLYAQTLLQRNLRLPAARRDWKEVESCLTRTPVAFQQSVEGTVLGAEVLAARGQIASAVKLLELAHSKHPKEIAVQVAHADLAQRDGQDERARALLAQAELELGDSPHLRFAWIRHWSRRGGYEARAVLTRLAKRPANYALSVRIRLLRELADSFARLGDPAQARRCWEQVAQIQPRDLYARSWLVEHLVASGQDAAAQQYVQQLRRIEGDQGVWWRAGEVDRLLALVKAGDKRHLTAVHRLLAELRSRDRDWSRLALLEAQLAQVEGNSNRALDHSLRALDLGERRPNQLLRIAHGLANRRRYHDAERVVRLLEESPSASPELARLGTQIALAHGDLPRALLRAKLAVPATTRDYREHLWLAEVYWRAGQAQQAEATLELAVSSSPANPQAWTALVHHLVRSRQKDKAHAAVLRAQARMPTDRWPLLSARLLETLGEHQLAESAYRNLLKEPGEDFVILAELADFYQRSDRSHEARALWRRMVDNPATVPATETARVRRLLAVELALTRQAAAYDQALTLLEANRHGRTLAHERARAIVNATRPAQRRAALHALDETLSRQAWTEEELLWLVRLHEEIEDGAHAEELMQILLESRDDNPQVLAYHVRMLLRRGKLVEARRQLTHLQIFEPDTARTRQLQVLFAKQN